MSDGATDMAQQVRDQLTNGVRVVELRNNTYAPLLRRKDYSNARAVLDELLQHAPQDILLLRDAASLHLKLKDADTAVDLIAKAMKLAGPADLAVAAHAIQIKLAAGRVDDAATIAQEHRQDWNHNLRLAHMSLLALTRTDTANPQDILKLAKKIAGATAATSRMRERAGSILLNLGEARACLDALKGTGIAEDGTATEFFLLAKAHHMSDRKSDAADALLERCLKLYPGHPQAAELRSLRYVESGEYAAAVDCLQQVSSDTYTKGIKLNYAIALSETGDHDRSMSLFKDVLEKDPQNDPMRKKIAGILAKNGLLADAQMIYKEGVARRAIALKPTFKESLERLLSSAIKTDIPKFRSDILFDALSGRGRAPDDKSEWETAVHRYHALDKLIVDWVECRPDAFDEIQPYLALSEDSLRLMSEETSKGRGLIVASAHVGILFAGPVMLRTMGYPFKWLASLPKLERDFVDENLISTTSNSEQNLTREFLSALNKGMVVTVAIDGSAETQRSKYPFLGEMIGLSEFVPLIAFRKGTPTLVPKLIWKDNQVHATLKKLPDPLDDEDAVTFVSRWMKCFLSVVEATVMEHPEQPRLAGGFWATLSR